MQILKRDGAYNKCKLALQSSRSSLEPCLSNLQVFMQSTTTVLAEDTVVKLNYPKVSCKSGGGGREGKRRTLLTDHFPQLLTELLFTVELSYYSYY